MCQTGHPGHDEGGKVYFPAVQQGERKGLEE